MEPKFKEQVKRNPNSDLKNTPIGNWPIDEKIKSVAGGPLYVAWNSGAFAKLWDALKKISAAGKTSNEKIPPLYGPAGPWRSLQPFKHGGYIR